MPSLLKPIWGSELNAVIFTLEEEMGLVWAIEPNLHFSETEAFTPGSYPPSLRPPRSPVPHTRV